jgi:hypothetical protein
MPGEVVADTNIVIAYLNGDLKMEITPRRL